MGKRLLAVAVCAAAFAVMGVGSAFAGEVKGPPGQAEPERTAAPAHANSICAFSGLNDGEPPPGRTAEHVQNWGQETKESREFLSSVGAHPGDACNGHTGFLTGE